MPYMMGGTWDGRYRHVFSFFGRGMIFVRLQIFLVMQILWYKDANKREVNGLLWAILVLILMIGVVLLVIYILGREGDEKKTAPAEKMPVDILRERYAKGESASDECRTRSEDLKNNFFRGQVPLSISGS